MRPAVLLVPVLLVPLLSACDVNTHCLPTTMTAQEATKVDVTGVKGSSVVRARLTVTSTGKGVAGKDVTMTLRDDGSDVYGASTRTQSDGKAALDLKGRLEAQAVVGLARANSFTASFDGDGQYCGSADDAVFRIVKTGL